MGCAALGIEPAGFVEAELAVNGQAHFRGVGVFLAVVLPPADGAQRDSAGRIQRLKSAARTSVAGHQGFHLKGLDGKMALRDYRRKFPVRGFRRQARELGRDDESMRGHALTGNQNRKTMPVVKRTGVPFDGDWMGALKRSTWTRQAKSGTMGTSTPAPNA